MLKFPLIVIALISFATPAFAGNKCAIAGFVKEKTEVFDKAKGGKRIGSLPGIYVGAGETPIPSMVEVQIIDSKDGWFKIMSATDNAALMEANEVPLRKMFGGTGWVDGTKLAVKSQRIAGFSKPDGSSELIVTPLGSDEPPIAFDDTETNHLVDCKDDWAYIEVDPSANDYDMTTQMKVSPSAIVDPQRKSFRIWVDNICAIQETSCDGLGE